MKRKLYSLILISSLFISINAKSQNGYDLFENPETNVGIIPVEKLAANITSMTKHLKDADENFISQNGKDQAWFDQQAVAYKKNPSGVDPVIAAHFRNSDDLRRKNDSDTEMFKNVTDKVTADNGGDVYSHIPANAPSIKYDTPVGQIIFSPREFVDFNYVYSKYIKTEGGEAVGGIGATTPSKTTYDIEAAKKELTPKQLMLFSIKKKRFEGGILTDNEKALNTGADVYNSMVNIPYQGVLSKIHDEIGAELNSQKKLEFGF